MQMFINQNKYKWNYENKIYNSPVAASFLHLKMKENLQLIRDSNQSNSGQFALETAA